MKVFTWDHMNSGVSPSLFEGVSIPGHLRRPVESLQDDNFISFILFTSRMRLLVGVILLVSTVLGEARDFHSVTPPNLSNGFLKADYIDPESAEFFPSRVMHHEESTRSVCTCTSLFAPNIYVGDTLPAELITALEYAQCLWSCVLATAVAPNSITLRVNGTQTTGNVLAFAGPFFGTFDGTRFIPCPLLGGGCGPDIDMSVDPDAVNYYFGTDGNVPFNQFDFVSVALHELGHGWGITGFINPSTGGSFLSAGRFVDIDRLIRYDQPPSSFPWISNPPSSLGAQAVISGSLFFEGNSYTTGKLFAPNPARIKYLSLGRSCLPSGKSRLFDDPLY
jgi:hypothetical protein